MLCLNIGAKNSLLHFVVSYWCFSDTSLPLLFDLVISRDLIGRINVVTRPAGAHSIAGELSCTRKQNIFYQNCSGKLEHKADDFPGASLR